MNIRFIMSIREINKQKLCVLSIISDRIATRRRLNGKQLPAKTQTYLQRLWRVTMLNASIKSLVSFQITDHSRLHLLRPSCNQYNKIEMARRIWFFLISSLRSKISCWSLQWNTHILRGLMSIYILNARWPNKTLCTAFFVVVVALCSYNAQACLSTYNVCVSFERECSLCIFGTIMSIVHGHTLYLRLLYMPF